MDIRPSLPYPYRTFPSLSLWIAQYNPHTYYISNALRYAHPSQDRLPHLFPRRPARRRATEPSVSLDELPVERGLLLRLRGGRPQEARVLPRGFSTKPLKFVIDQARKEAASLKSEKMNIDVLLDLVATQRRASFDVAIK